MKDETIDFEIKDLCVSIDSKPILKGVNLQVKRGETHAIMGPNGSGKSTLANLIMGHPGYEVTGGDIFFKGRNIMALAPEERARLGLFLAFQYPVAIPGVTVAKFMKTAVDSVCGAQKVKSAEFLKSLKENMAYLEMNETFSESFPKRWFLGG